MKKSKKKSRTNTPAVICISLAIVCKWGHAPSFNLKRGKTFLYIQRKNRQVCVLREREKVHESTAH